MMMKNLIFSCPEKGRKRTNRDPCTQHTYMTYQPDITIGIGQFRNSCNVSLRIMVTPMKGRDCPNKFKGFNFVGLSC